MKSKFEVEEKVFDIILDEPVTIKEVLQRPQGDDDYLVEDKEGRQSLVEESYLEKII